MGQAVKPPPTPEEDQKEAEDLAAVVRPILARRRPSIGLAAVFLLLRRYLGDLATHVKAANDPVARASMRGLFDDYMKGLEEMVLRARKFIDAPENPPPPGDSPS